MDALQSITQFVYDLFIALLLSGIVAVIVQQMTR